ncbi:MAG: glycosyltransferase [Candidatus Omnitrophica bacterium]|nr:glycosyltransferase [Candidatus Omnitrophota bacterium]
MKRNPFANLLNSGDDRQELDTRKKLVMWWQNLWIDKFFAIRDLYKHALTVIPDKKIIREISINSILDIEPFYPSYIFNKTPVLVHAPTDPLVKGSRYVDKGIDELRSEGYIFKYIRLKNVTNIEAKRIYKEADIIIDQLLIGAHGVLAIEGMYYGKPVFCYLTDDFVMDNRGCPVVNCNIDTFKDKLAWLLDHPEEMVRIGKEGRAYVEKNYDPAEINAKVVELYREMYER